MGVEGSVSATDILSQHAPVDDAVSAEAVAEALHAGVEDKAGAPYIGHPRRVAGYAGRFAAALRLDAAAVEAVVIAALLHDVVEDTDVTIDELAEAGVPGQVLAALRLLTHGPDQSYREYVRRAAADPLARLVKAADLCDNLDPRRVARLDEATAAELRAKYRPALALIADEDPELARAVGRELG